jgi:hypothetical protein
MQCKFLKLTNGDDIIAMVNDEYISTTTASHIQIQDPVMVSSARFPRGNMIVETYLMQPWIKLSRSNIMVIPTSTIVAAVDITDSAIEQYNQFLEMTNSEEEIDTRHIEAVPSEDIFKQLMEAVAYRDESDEEEEDDGATRTLH